MKGQGTVLYCLRLRQLEYMERVKQRRHRLARCAPSGSPSRTLYAGYHLAPSGSPTRTLYAFLLSAVLHRLQPSALPATWLGLGLGLG